MKSNPTLPADASENTPLLHENGGSANKPTNGHITGLDPEQGTDSTHPTTQHEPETSDDGPNDDGAPDGDDEVVFAEEPSTKKLIATMASMWIGVFFAALGMFSPWPSS